LSCGYGVDTTDVQEQLLKKDAGRAPAQAQRFNESE